MTRKTLTYYSLLLTLLALLTACTSDDDAAVELSPSAGKAHVMLRIGTEDAFGPATRAWTDANAKADPDRTEMMYSWLVVLTDNSNKVVFTASSETVADANAEIDIVSEGIDLEPGDYKAYSFANIPTTSLPASLTGATAGSTTLSADDLAAIDNAVLTVNGNGFVPSDNGGIPMSGRQTLTIVSDDVQKDLVVIRMLAKMEIQLYNETGSDVTVQSVAISDVTANVENNLKLMPNLTDADNANTMEAVHKDIQPNLNGTPAKTEFTYVVPTAQQTVASTPYADNVPGRTLTFYVNESTTPANPDGLFYLTLKMSDGEYRYAMINQKGKTSADDDAWHYIARNDYRVLPIVIDDYKLELIPYDFPPIGVYPASVKEVDASANLYEMTFHDYGHFHLLPRVTKRSTSAIVPYGSPTGTNDGWTLMLETTEPAATAWQNSFFTATAKGGAWLDAAGITATTFYRDQTATADGDDAGGAPVWYANDGTTGPQWDPALTTGGTPTYQPFIFGYIADPEDNPSANWTAGHMAAEKQLYHEFRARLFVNGSYRRDMVYRFYMTLSTDQMLYPASSRAVRRHVLHHSH